MLTQFVVGHRGSAKRLWGTLLCGLVLVAACSKKDDPEGAATTTSKPAVVAAASEVEAETDAKPKLSASGSKSDCKGRSAEIVKDLEVLAANAAVQQFGSFLTYLPCQVEARVYGAGQFQGQGKAEPKPIDIWSGAKFGTVQAIRYNEWAGLKAFKADPDRLIFVKLAGPGGIGDYVPEEVMQGAEAAFINGLITRLALGELTRSQTDEAGQIIEVPKAPKASWNVKLNQYTIASQWNKKSYEDVLRDTAYNYPVQGPAILEGWALGDIVDGDARLREATWRLLRLRIDTPDIGQAVGYTLNYLEGYQKGLKVRAQQAPKNPPGAELTLGKSSMEEAKKAALAPTSYATVNEKVFNLLVIAMTSGDLKHDDRARVGQFLSSYNLGSIRAAEVVYADVFALAYGMGYADGFRGGYARGYSEGYRAGTEDATDDFIGRLSELADKVGPMVKNVQKISENVAKVVVVLSAGAA